ncbi:hypothetical protein MTP99_016805 [Tenebrio molitor]|nr:hypothetical protein MTP99_016805 [Tenebrio molitor]
MMYAFRKQRCGHDYRFLFEDNTLPYGASISSRRTLIERSFAEFGAPGPRKKRAGVGELFGGVFLGRYLSRQSRCHWASPTTSCRIVSGHHSRVHSKPSAIK